MANEEKLVKKVKRLLRRLGCPRWLHRYGPKTYEFLEHLQALLMRAFCRLSYRRVIKLFDLFGIRCPSKSALQYTAAKLDAGFWQRVLRATCGATYLVAVDSTCFSRSNPSYHYLHRIDGKMPKVPIKASLAYDTRKKKYAAARIHVLPRHDIRDIKTLLHHAQPTILVADKAYDAAWVHDHCADNNIQTHIPLRRCGTPRFHRWDQRHIAAKKFRKRTYHRREIIEAANHSIKQTMGSNVNSKKARTIRTELYGRLTCHNLFFWLSRDLGQTPWSAKDRIESMTTANDRLAGYANYL